MLEAIAIDTAAMTGLVGLVAGALWLSRKWFEPDTLTIVDAVEAVLPQTQCAQCGYPGCRPYAEAVVSGSDIDLCPPGGRDTQLALARLLGRQSGKALEPVAPVKARIDESRCIGCYLCAEACPVDAIVGAPRFMHTVLEDRCTGCELCLPPCPVDCIDLLAVDADLLPPTGLPPAETEADGCIRCNRCEAACPESLPVADLWWWSREDDLERARGMGLDRCIECGLCNPACPSGIDLTGTFIAARASDAFADRARAAAVLARQHFDEHNERLERYALITSDRRSQRLAAFRKQTGE
jgi:electron transport complex protein RnfB